MRGRLSTPKATTPMCDEARALPTLGLRLRHYRACSDSRCQERERQSRELAKAIAKGTAPRQDS